MESQLRQLQQGFVDYIIGKNQDILDAIVSTEKVPAKLRMAIYSNAYEVRLLETLKDNFEGLQGLVGDESFEKIGRLYIHTQGSNFRNIRWFGDKLAQFLETTKPYSNQSVMAEMAKVDWALLFAFDSKDAQAVGFEAFTKIEPEQWPTLTFRFHPSVQRLDLKWNVFRFRKQLTEEDESITAPDANEELVPWVVWRKEMVQYYRSMEIDEAWMMDQVKNGANFSQLCEGICEWIDPDNAAGRAATILKSWIDENMILDYATLDQQLGQEESDQI